MTAQSRTVPFSQPQSILSSPGGHKQGGMIPSLGLRGESQPGMPSPRCRVRFPLAPLWYLPPSRDGQQTFPPQNMLVHLPCTCLSSQRRLPAAVRAFSLGCSPQFPFKLRFLHSLSLSPNVPRFTECLWTLELRLMGPGHLSLVNDVSLHIIRHQMR